jgi:hypothetical protein
MNYSNNYAKYYLKNQLIGGVELQLIQNLGIESELELYIPLNGGDSSEIWPIITNNFMKNKKLGIRSKTNPAVDFEFIPNHLGKIDEPILGRGTFTAVYQLKNVNNPKDTTKYILRLYMRDLTISPKHMNFNNKISSEYTTYNKYMIKNYYFGELKIKDNNFTYDSNKDIFNIIPETLKDYNFDYVITKVYQTPLFNNLGYVTELSNQQKFKFLYNNIVMLDELQKNNCFHADYKIGNVGWESSDKMNVILIDYDINTIQNVNESNPKIKINDNKIVVNISFPSTYIPEYLKHGDGIKAIPLNQYIKYSIGGLYNIFKVLNVQYNFDTLEIDFLSNRNITILDSKDIGNSLHLTNTNYDLIPRFSEIKNVFDMLIKNRQIKNYFY